MKQKWIRALIIAVAAVLVGSSIAFAIADPDSPPQISAVYVYVDLLEDGDTGVLIDYYLDYDLDTPPVGTPPPDEPVSDAYLAMFVDTDNITQLQVVAPYTFVDNGYGRGLVWIYFTEAETTAYGLTVANEALYRIWLVGNPSLSWAGDPPKIIAGIDDWQTTGEAATLVALRVLYYADILELIWSLDMVESTPIGNKLTTTGATYFTNVIANLRTIAPAAFPTGTYYPVMEDIDYSREFGATITDGTGTLPVSPLTLATGATTVVVTVTGTFLIELNDGVAGDVTTGTTAVTGTPVDIVAGTNTITTTGAGGNIIVDVALDDTMTRLEGTLLGTGLDLTDAADEFGMSRLMFSGLVWLVVSVLICAGSIYKGTEQGFVPGGGKIVLLVFDVCIIGGTLLGLLHPIVAVLLFIGFGAFTGYIWFFRPAAI